MAAAGAHESLEEQLFEAIEKGKNELAVGIIETVGLDINAQDPKDGKTALMYAIIMNFPDVIDALMKKNANIKNNS